MIVRGLDTDHDWLFGKGRNDYLVNIKAVGQNINTRLSCFLNDCFFDLNAGIDWFQLCGGKDLTSLTLAVSSVILNTAYVTGIIQLNLDLNALRRVTVTYQVNTAFSATLNDTFEFNQGVL
jgi:hypothetical protein